MEFLLFQKVGGDEKTEIRETFKGVEPHTNVFNKFTVHL